MPTVETNGVETYYERWGEGYPIVFIHGSAWDSRQWTPQIETLKDEFEVVVYDYRGHGNTGIGDFDDYISIELLADDLSELIQKLGLNNPCVVGLSMGGLIAQEYAKTYRNQLSGLVTYESRTETDIPDGLLGGSVFKLYMTAYSVFGIERTYHLSKLYRKYISGQQLGQKNEIQVRGLEMTKREYISTAMKKLDEDMFDYLFQSGGYDEGDLSRITVPTLCLVGEFPAERHIEAAERMEQEIPDCDTGVVSDADHGGNMTNTSEFNARLKNLIKNDINSP